MSGKWAKPALICGAAILLLALGIWLSGDSLPVFIRRLFTLSYLPQLSPGVSLFTVALFGFLTSFHCIGMCGGTVLALSEDQPTLGLQRRRDPRTDGIRHQQSLWRAYLLVYDYVGHEPLR